MALPLLKAVLALSAGAATSLIAFCLLPPGTWTQAGLLSFALCWASAVDLDRQILPDVLTFGLSAFGLAYAFQAGTPQFAACLIGALAGYGSFLLVSRLYLRLRGRPGLGLGDAKLLAAAGAWLGWSALPYVVLVASGFALLLIVARRVAGHSFHALSRLAFGPFLAVALWSVWLASNLGVFLT
jgi:leader peptidase (prepilin peptidase)/N-methyltransferase